MREPERRTDGYNYHRKMKVILAGLSPVFLAVLGWAALSGLEWYNFGNLLRDWKPRVELQLDNHEQRLRMQEVKQDQKQEQILDEIRRLRRDVKEKR